MSDGDLELAVDGAIGARHVSLETAAGAAALGDQLDAVRQLARDGATPTYYPDLVAALGRGGVDGGAQRYGYLVVSDRRGVLAAAPTAVTGEVLVDLLCGPGLVRAAGDLLRRFSGLATRTLCVGTALDQSGGALIRGGADPAAALAAFDLAVAEVARLRGCRAVLYKDIARDGAAAELLGARRYRSFAALPGARLDLSRFACLGDYLEWIREAASYGDLRRKIRSGGYDSAGLRAHLGNRAAAEIAAGRRRSAMLRDRAGAPGGALSYRAETAVSATDVDQMFELYRLREASARFRWAPLSRLFFDRLAAMPEVRFSVCRDGDRVLGFSSALELGERYVTIRSGVDPALARPLSLPVLMVLRDIETAIERGLSEITLGPTGYALKARFGVEFDATVAMLHLGPLTGLVCRTVDAANRRAGIHELAAIDYRSAFAPRESR